ncbi:MAG: hypothetical protein EBU90_09040 [Proteobacteria bacterium]|nr:hypothetical protein [Pseudomonadota bacterium]
MKKRMLIGLLLFVTMQAAMAKSHRALFSQEAHKLSTGELTKEEPVKKTVIEVAKKEKVKKVKAVKPVKAKKASSKKSLVQSIKGSSKPKKEKTAAPKNSLLKKETKAEKAARIAQKKREEEQKYQAAQAAIPTHKQEALAHRANAQEHHDAVKALRKEAKAIEKASKKEMTQRLRSAQHKEDVQQLYIQERNLRATPSEGHQQAEAIAKQRRELSGYAVAKAEELNEQADEHRAQAIKAQAKAYKAEKMMHKKCARAGMKCSLEDHNKNDAQIEVHHQMIKELKEEQAKAPSEKKAVLQHRINAHQAVVQKMEVGQKQPKKMKTQKQPKTKKMPKAGKAKTVKPVKAQKEKTKTSSTAKPKKAKSYGY